MNLKFRKFSERAYQGYKTWFKDVDLQEALGDVDDEWLDYILNDPKGDEWAIYLEEELVCVIGMVLPNESHPFLHHQQYCS